VVPLGAIRLLEIAKNITIKKRDSATAPVPYYKILEDRQVGYLSSIVVSLDSQKAAIMLEMDNQAEEFTVEELINYGMLEYIPENFYLEKADTANNIYVIAYISQSGEIYNEKIRIFLKNYSTADPVNVGFIKVKRWRIKEMYK